MGDTTDIKKGVVIKYQNNLWVVSDFNFVNPGKGSAFYKTKLKGIQNNKTIEITFKSGETIDTVDVFRTNMQYLYKTDNRYSFMNNETYETVEVDEEILGDDAKYLKEGLICIVATYEGAPVSVQLPKKVTYTVVTAPPAVKGDTASGNVTKEVELDNGLLAQAPIFIKEGDQITLNTETGAYDGRVS